MSEDPLISPELLAIMQCPACSGELLESREPPSLVCQQCGHVYPVTDGIPVMLLDEDVTEYSAIDDRAADESDKA